MSAAAAGAAGGRALGPRPRLRAVPDQAGPAPRRGASHPLVLGRDARARLRRAVRELLNLPGLKGLPDSARLLVVVLAAKTSAESGVAEVRAGELARWLGLSVSRVRRIVRKLREANVVKADTATGDWDEHTGLRCEVRPLWDARGKPGHPLALVRREFAVLLRLAEAVFGPGWRHRDRPDTPAGLLAWRKGRGGSTDRLALLVLVLEARETGRVRLCGGKVSARGRAAATLARLLGCGLAGAEAVLERLEAAGLVARPRRETVSGLRHRGRLVVPAVAAAHGRSAASVVREQRVRGAKSDFSDPDVVPGLIDGLATEEDSQVEEELATEEAETPDSDVAPSLHADHASEAGDCGRSAGEWCCSGEAASGYCDRPGCARACEGGPLRGDQPETSPNQLKEDRAPGRERGPESADAAARLLTSVATGHDGQQQRGVPPRPPADLEVILAPVAALWARLERGGARHVVVRAARVARGAVAAVIGSEGVDEVVAARLTRRLRDQGGPDAVTDPVGWLVGRGLSCRSSCADGRCDEGRLMDTGESCESCEVLVAGRRAVRHEVAAQVDAELLGAKPAERRAATEERLRQRTAVDAEWEAVRHERAVAARAAREAEAARFRAEADAAEKARQALPCEDCGAVWTPTWRVTGLCVPCGDWRAVETAMGEAVQIAAASRADLADPADIADVTEYTETMLRAERDQTVADARAQGQTETIAAVCTRNWAERTAVEYRRSALALLRRTEAAEAEARRAYGTALRNQPLDAPEDEAKSAAAQVAQQARQRTAEHLLTTQLAQMRAATRPTPEPVDDGPICAGCGKDVRRVTPGGLCLGCEQVRLNREARSQGRDAA